MEALPNEIHLNIITFTSIAIALLLFGNLIGFRVNWIKRFSIPSPVIGGFIFSLVAFIGWKFNWFVFTTDNTLYDLLMYIFFVTIGLSSSLSLIAKGGKALVVYIMFCWLLALLQNIVGIVLSYVTGLNPLIGLMASQPGLQGGHGMAASMAPVVEAAGVDGALNVGLATATFGLIVGSLLGGPIGTYLIKKYKPEIKTEVAQKSLRQKYGIPEKNIDNIGILKALFLIFAVLAVGFPLADFITNKTGVAMPGHILSLFIGILLRSILEKQKRYVYPEKEINLISIVSLELFLVMAMMSLKIWELFDLALPLLIILIAQTLVIVLLVVLVMYQALGKNYDAAVMCGGFIGHGLGATPNGLMVIDAISKNYGVRSVKALLFIPISGTVLTDIFGVPLFLFLVNLFQ